MNNLKTLQLDEIRIDGGTQPRASIDQELLSEYADAMQAGDIFPPVTVFYDGVHHWLADGFHRYWANQKIGANKLKAEIRHGTQRDAVLFSVGANAAHGGRRTNEDKRRAVLTLLQDEEWGKWSDREIARQCNVTHPFVGKLRSSSLVPVTSDPAPQERTYTNKHGKQSTMRTGNAGKQTGGMSTKDHPPSKNTPCKRDKGMSEVCSAAKTVFRLSRKSFSQLSIVELRNAADELIAALARATGAKMEDW